MQRSHQQVRGTIIVAIYRWTESETQGYNDQTPVVVAELTNAQAGAVFGVSKIKVSFLTQAQSERRIPRKIADGIAPLTKNGNRYEQIDLAMMCVVFYPPTGSAKAWLTV